MHWHFAGAHWNATKRVSCADYFVPACLAEGRPTKSMIDLKLRFFV